MIDFDELSIHFKLLETLITNNQSILINESEQATRLIALTILIK